MDLLKNPFHILGATPRDNRHRIIELEEERSLLSDADACMEARSILTHPRQRISAEVAWLPGIDPFRTERTDEVLRRLDAPNQNLLNIAGLTPIARANLLASGLARLPNLSSSNILAGNTIPFRGIARLPNLSSSNIVEWIFTIAQASEAINSEMVHAILSEDRRASGFPEITDLSTLDDEIRKQKRYYSETISSVLENLSVSARALVMTSLLETATGNGRYQSPTLIRDLIPAYELSVQDSLDQNRTIIEAQDARLRAMVDANNPDTTLAPIVDQLLVSLKEWDTLVQPIQLSQTSTGQRHDASFEMAWRFRKLAADLFLEHRKSDFSKKILNTLTDVFSEVPEIAEQIDEDLRELEEQARLVRSVEEFEEINTQVERLTEAADARRPDYTLTPMVNQLIQTVNTWDTSTPPIEVNNAVAIAVRNIALHLWNEHQKLDFAIQITNALIVVFRGVEGMDEVNNRLNEDIKTLYTMDTQRKQVIEQQQRSVGDSCLFKIVTYGIIFGVLALIGALSQGC